MSDFAVCTMTLHDALKCDPEMLDFISLRTPEQTTKFTEMFKARWDIYEIGGETIELSKRFFANRFNQYKEYYQELIDDYENRINYLNGVIVTETHSENYSADGSIGKTDSATRNNTYTDLPNRTTVNNYATNKDETSESIVTSQTYEDAHDKTLTISRNGDVNILDQKIKYQKYLRNVYLEFAERFKDCFALIYN